MQTNKNKRTMKTNKEFYAKKYKIRCEYPNFILNPKLHLYIRKGYTTILDGMNRFELSEENIVSDEKHYVRLPECYQNFRQYFSVKKEYADDVKYKLVKIDEYPISNKFYDEAMTYVKQHRHCYYVVYRYSEDKFNSILLLNEKTGEFVNLYLEVPCGNCTLCRSKSLRMQEARNQLQMCSQNNRPFFVTLTFDNVHNPGFKVPIEVQTDILQRFHKRLRKHLSKDGWSTDYKYFAVSEYGGKDGRFHYHIIFYNTPYALDDTTKNEDLSAPFRTVFKFHNYIYRAWKLGIIIRTEKLRNSNIEYLTKYMLKQKFDVNGDRSTKYWKSIYLGLEAIYQFKENVVASIGKETFTVNNLVSGAVKIPMYSFVKKALFPPLVTALKKDIRDQLRDVAHVMAYMTTKDVPNKYWEIFRKPQELYVKYIELLAALDMDFDTKNTHTLPSFFIKKYYNYQDLCEFVTNTLEDIDTYLEIEGLDIKHLLQNHMLYMESMVFTNDLEFDIQMEKYKVLEENAFYLNEEKDNQLVINNLKTQLQ